MLLDAADDKQTGMFRRCAVDPMNRSAWGHDKAHMPMGAIPKGTSKRSPRMSVQSDRFSVFSMTLGCILISSNRARFCWEATSRPAAPSMKSKTSRGSRRFARRRASAASKIREPGFFRFGAEITLSSSCSLIEPIQRIDRVKGREPIE